MNNFPAFKAYSLKARDEFVGELEPFFDILMSSVLLETLTIALRKHQLALETTFGEQLPAAHDPKCFEGARKGDIASVSTLWRKPWFFPC